MDISILGGVYRNDGVDIEYNGNEGISYNIGWTEAGEWLGYTIEDVSPGTYDIDIRVAGFGGILFSSARLSKSSSN